MLSWAVPDNIWQSWAKQREILTSHSEKSYDGLFKDFLRLWPLTACIKNLTVSVTYDPILTKWWYDPSLQTNQIISCFKIRQQHYGRLIVSGQVKTDVNGLNTRPIHTSEMFSAILRLITTVYLVPFFNIVKKEMTCPKLDFCCIFKSWQQFRWIMQVSVIYT